MRTFYKRRQRLPSDVLPCRIMKSEYFFKALSVQTMPRFCAAFSGCIIEFCIMIRPAEGGIFLCC